MARKRKGAGDNTEPRQRRPRVAPTETTAGPQAPAAGDLQPLPGSSSLQGQFALRAPLLRGFDPLLGNPGRTATSQALVNAQGFGGGLGRGGGSARTTMLQQSLRNAYPASGSAPFGIHAASGQNQIANPGQTGTEQPHGNSGASSSSGGGGGSGAGFGGFSQFAGGIHAPTGYGFSAGVIGQPHGNSSGPSSAGLRCSDCNELTTSHLGSVPLCQACYGNHFTVNAGAHQGRIPDPAGRCIVCKNSTRMYWVASMPLCSDCYRKIFASNGPLQYLQPFLAGLRRGGVSQSTPPVGNLAGGILATASRGNQTGAAQPHGNSGGPSAAISLPRCATAACNEPATVPWGSVFLCLPCYRNRVAIGQQRQPSSAEPQPQQHGHSSSSGLELGLAQQPSSPAPAQVAVACSLCKTLTTARLVHDSGRFLPLCEDCHGQTRYVPSCGAARQGQQPPEVDLDLRLSRPSSKACIYNHRSDEVCSYCYRGG